MKFIFLVPDGAADYPCEELGSKTPLEMSKIPNMNALAKAGRVGLCNNIPPKMQPGSDVGNLSLLGYDPRKYYCGRGPIEAANMGVKLEEGEVAFRMNLVTESEGKLVDYSAGHISTKEARALVKHLNSRLASDFLRFFPGVSYRHLAVIKDAYGLKGLSAKCYPPHDIVGKKVKNYLPKGAGQETLRKIMNDAKMLLQDHEINQVRVDLKENPANLVWFWGQGVTPEMESFKKKYGLTGAIISAVDLVKGIGRLIGLTVIEVPGATGYVDTNYAGKAEAALDALKEKDFVYVHVEAPDEASHEGNIRLKISALENFDSLIVGPIRKYCETNPDTRVCVIPDHATPCSLRTHTPDAVPFIIAGKNVVADDIDRFSEERAQYSDLKIKDGHRLMEFFVGNR